MAYRNAFLFPSLPILQALIVRIITIQPLPAHLTCLAPVAMIWAMRISTAPWTNSPLRRFNRKKLFNRIHKRLHRGGNSSSYSYSSYPSSAYSSYNYNSSCPSGLSSILGAGCHYMYNDPSGNSIYCNGEMTKSAKAGDTATTDGCSSGGGNYSSYSYSSYNYTPPSGQREQIWNSYGLKSWVRTDADSAKIETLKQACANVTYGSGDIWMSGAGDYNSVNFGMPDEAKCRSWTPGSSSSYSYSSYNPASSASYSSYSYSSYPTNSSSYSSYSYSSYNYPQCDWSTQYLKNSTQTCMPKTDCYNTANADYNSSECQGVRGFLLQFV